VIYPKNKQKFTAYIGLFIASVLNIDTYKCAYGRQYRKKTFNQHKIKLPVTKEGSPDWQFMEDLSKVCLIQSVCKNRALSLLFILRMMKIKTQN
jgi:hypothetical protein